MKEEAKFVTVNMESATGEDLGKVSYIPLPNVDYIPKQERMYSEEEVINILNEYWDVLDLWYNDCILNVPKAAIWFNQYYKK
jgi:hypothetical protein